MAAKANLFQSREL